MLARSLSAKLPAMRYNDAVLYEKRHTAGCVVMNLKSTIAKAGPVLRRHSPAAAAYLVLTLLFTYPLALRLRDAIGGGVLLDTFQNYWNLWWVGHALLDLQQNPYHATTIQYPFGLPMFFHTYNFLNGLISLPVQVCCGPTVAFNLMYVFAFTMAGIGAYVLVWYLTQHRGAAFVAGLIYAFSPYMAFHLDVGQPFMVSLQWFPFYLWLLLRGLREHWRFLPWAALLLFMIGLTDWHYTVYALLLTGIVGLYEMARLRAWRPVVGVVGRLALVGALFALAMAPIVVPMLLEVQTSDYAVRDLRHSIYHSTDLAAFFAPSIFHPLWGEWASELFYGRLVETFIIGGIASLGYIPLALGLVGALGERRRSALYALLFGVFFVLALGPYLRVFGWQSADSAVPIPLPYLLFRELPFMDIHRIPSRFVAVVMLALAVLAGLGVHWLAQRPRIAALPAWQQRGLFMLLALLLLFEYWPRPFRMTPVGLDEIPPFYQQLAASEGDSAVLEMPDLDARAMFYQTYHHRPLMGGQLARRRGHPWRRARFVGAFLRMSPEWQDAGRENMPELARSALRCQDIRYVVMYNDEGTRADRRSIRALEAEIFAGIAPIHSDEIMRVYEVHNERPDVPYWTFDPQQWRPLGMLPELDAMGRWNMGQEGSLLIYPCGQSHVLLSFDIFSYERSRTVEILLDGEPLGRFDLPLGWVRRVALPLPLHDGENRLTLRSVEPADMTRALAADGSIDPEVPPYPISLNVSQVSVEEYQPESTDDT
jgi:hypothetical protein